MENIPQVGFSILILCNLVLAISVNINAQAIECLASDQEALIDFKNGLEDSNNRLSSWRNTNCCQWHGIYCDNVTGAVVAIDLHGADKMWHLSGELRPSLMKLKSLSHLDLSFNTFKEIPIPKFFGSLENYNLTARCSQLFMKGWGKIQELDLSFNKLHGRLVSSFGNLTSLTYLDLSHNAIEGGIPSSIGKLCNLNTLDLSKNNLTGTLPKFLQRIDNCPSKNPLPNLEQFSIGYNQLNGLLQNLLVLELGGNNLNGTLPNSLGLLSQLVWLDVSSNQLTGVCQLDTTIPIRVSWYGLMCFGAFISTMAEITDVTLDLSFNLLEGLVPVTTSGFDLLDLSHNRFSGAIPLNISQHMNYLEFLSLSDNQLHGEIPVSLGEMFYVIVIDLSGNNLTGRIPPNLANCSFLNVLDLGNNNLFGTIPDSLGQLKRLKSLHLNNNHFSGNLPSSLRNLSSLETMDISYNILSGTLPPWFGQNFPFLIILILRSNAFCGELSLEFSKLSSLQVLDLARNDFSGNIPNSLGDLKAIAQVQKKNRYLLYGKYDDHYYEESLNVYTKGQILRYTKTLSLVTSIDHSDNNFSGNISNQITKLFGLVVLNLSRNHITGQIPETMSNLLQLSSLDLSNNQLFGTIPSSMSSLSFLGSLDFSNNNLMGAIPYMGHTTTFDAIAFTGNPGLCGPPLPVMCSSDDYKRQRILVPYFILTMKSSWSDVYFDFVDQVAHKILMLSHRQEINHGQRRRIPRRR
ncbi:hypothetical protein TSUD_268530 [Trifolium subterraneum]|uniref:Leucine-rich repeat-containing N-terminal plant-type domain-containing protein n=1 Tax=Trifolium subterraneum TaxID=3900 RepID=A0A2Z6PC07_TRISU|nr:hypothetical protein TSUD_268530 [Trifolium subterraneum]